MKVFSTISQFFWQFSRSIGVVCMPSRLRSAVSVRLQEVDDKIREQNEQQQTREERRNTTSDPEMRADFEKKIAENIACIRELTAERIRVVQEQDQQAVSWGTGILIVVFIVILAACAGVWHAAHNRAIAVEAQKIEDDRYAKFQMARQELVAYLGSVEKQLESLSDTHITFNDAPLESLKQKMLRESEINESSELTARAETLKVAIIGYNRRIDRLPFNVPFKTAKESADKAKSESPYDPTILNKEALQIAEKNTQSIEDEQDVQNLQKEFDRIQRLSYQQSFSIKLAAAESFLEKKEIDKAEVPKAAAREIFDANKVAMRQEAETDLLAVENDYKRLVQERENEKIAGDFAALFGRAEQSYKDATQKANDPRDELLDTDALNRAKKLFDSIVVADQTRFSELETRFTALKSSAVTQRSQKLTTKIEPLAIDHNRIIGDNDLSPPQRYDALAKLLQKINDVAEDTEREVINRRPITEAAQVKLDQLLAHVKKDWQEVYPQAITQTIGDIDLYLAELRRVNSLKDFRSHDFLKVLENPAAFCFETTRYWNHFVNENGTALDTYPPSTAILAKIFPLLDNDTIGLASVPELVVMKANRKYYEESALRGNRLRNFVLQFRLHSRLNEPYVVSINNKITDIANSSTTPQQATQKLFDLLGQITRERSESSCLRLYIAFTLVNELVQTYRDYLHTTVSWRSRYVGQFNDILKDTNCRKQTCSHHIEAEKFLAVLPLTIPRFPAQNFPLPLLLEPPQELSGRTLAVEYVWVGWADRINADVADIVLRIKQENIPKTNFESSLYAKLPDVEVMSIVGDLSENKAGIVPANKNEIRCGTPVYVRRQWVSEP